MGKASKLLIDENVHHGLAATLRQHGYDAVSAQEAGLRQTPDLEIFDYAINEKRAIVTFNLIDFKRLVEDALKQGKVFHGVIIGTHDKGFKITLREVLRILRDYDQENLRNNLLYFP